MVIQLPEKVRYIIDRLESKGYPAYAVGGCIRDCCLGRTPADWDITTAARPMEIRSLFRKTIDTGMQHGTVTVLLGGEAFEVTTFRIDGVYEDGRHPKEVTFTPDLYEDLRRRDFTINAMAYNERDGFVDLFGGLKDLKERQIRCVGRPEDRFSEDALRMMRTVRFSAQLNFSIEPDTFRAIRTLFPLLTQISAERVQAELVKLLVSDHPEKMLELYRTRITDAVLPEFSVMMQTPQNNAHHCYTVGEHTVLALQRVRADKVLRLAVLFHDVAKPACRAVDHSGTDHFDRHPDVGADMTRGILRRLKFDNETIRRVTALVRIHDDRPQLSAGAVRHQINRAGLSSYPDFFAVKRADILAQSMYRRKEKIAKIDLHEKLYRQILRDGDCLCVQDLAVNGRDLIEAGMRPGPEIGALLNRMLDDVLDTPEHNDREYLLRTYI